MTHNEHLGALIAAILTDYTAVDIRSLDLEQYFEQEAANTSRPSVYCSGTGLTAMSDGILGDGEVLGYHRTGTAALMAIGRDLDDDADTLLDGLNASASARTYTRDGATYLVIAMATRLEEATYGFPVTQIEFDIKEL